MKSNVSTLATVDKFMNKNLIILKGDLPLTVACRRFFDHKIGSLLIECSSDKSFACLTKTDIINVIGKGEDPGLILSQDAASKPLITITANESLENAMLKMAKNKLKRIFITENNSKNIIGVISSSDILRIAPGLLEIAREEYLIQDSGFETNKTFSGNCDDCKQFSEFLNDLGGFALCENCIKSRQDGEEDLESLNSDEED